MIADSDVYIAVMGPLVAWGAPLTVRGAYAPIYKSVKVPLIVDLTKVGSLMVVGKVVSTVQQGQHGLQGLQHDISLKGEKLDKVGNCGCARGKGDVADSVTARHGTLRDGEVAGGRGDSRVGTSIYGADRRGGGGDTSRYSDGNRTGYDNQVRGRRAGVVTRDRAFDRAGATAKGTPAAAHRRGGRPEGANGTDPVAT